MRITFIFLLGIFLAAAACSKKKEVKEPEPVVNTETDPVEDTGSQDTMDTSSDEADDVATAEPALELRNVYFEFDSSILTDTARDRLANNARWLEQHTESQLRIEGHADERGTPEYNIALGMERARVIKEYLMRMGIEADRLKTVSYGEERPIMPGKHEKNRRAEFEPI